MAGYNPNGPMGNDQGSILHALFQGSSGAPNQQQQQQASMGSQNGGSSFQAGQGFNQSFLHEMRAMNDPRSQASSGVASPASRQQSGMFGSYSGTPSAQMAQPGAPKADQQNNLLHLLTQMPQAEHNHVGALNQNSFGNDRVQLDQRSVSYAGDHQHKASNPISRSFSHQQQKPVASHATADSLLALLNQPKPATQQQTQPPHETGARAQQGSIGSIGDIQPNLAANGINSLSQLLGIKEVDLPNKVEKPAEKFAEKSADELTESLADMLSTNPLEKAAADGQGLEEVAKDTEHASNHDQEDQKTDTATVKTSNVDKNAVVDNPEIASVIDGIDHLNVDASKSAAVAETEKAESSDKVGDAAVDESVADDWENSLSANGDANEGHDNTKTLVDVYNFFPLQPFISITINGDVDMSAANFPTDEDATMAIARLKKTFDQNDRTLVTATKDFIIFAMSKNGGVRIVRQDDGKNKMVFEETQDQIFNVAACVDKDNQCETVVATGCSGTVYYFMAKDARGESIEDITPQHSFALPPIQSPGDENPGGVLKTRARKSSNHTRFFGVGRGKSIHIIFPNTITMGDFFKPGTARTVDVEKYLAHRTLKIDTGKAAKDFTFSQDDTTVVSLDKAGRIKFWDIRGLTDNDDKPQAVELTEPLLTLVTTPANEKSWPTSIIFIDKLRRVMKNTALRYLLVGMKQNHTLQLWDLALRRIVQEIHLPHDKDSDAACSVVYHVATGMIVVGHPTRNSIYFIHVSLPRFSHKSLSQADFVEQVGKGTFPAPGTSAAFSTIREYKFSEGVKPETGSDKRRRGDLRSLDILQEPANIHDKSILFELYTMHSTGVTSIAIRPETLGLNADLTDIKTLSASEVGLTTYSKLKPIDQTSAQKEMTSPPAATAGSAKSPPQVKEILRKPASSSAQAESATMTSPTKKVDNVQKVVSEGHEAAAVAPEKSEKRKKRKSSASSRGIDASVVAAASSKPMQSIPEGQAETMSLSPADVEKMVGQILTGFTLAFDKVMECFEEQRGNASENQLQLLAVVSKTLTENVDGALGRIISEQFKTVIAPGLNGTILEVLEKSVPYHLKNIMNGIVQTSVAKEIQNALTGALTKALSSPQFTKQMSQMMSQLGLAREVTHEGTQQSLRNVLSGIADVKNQGKENAHALEALAKQRQRDAEAIDQLVKQREADAVKIDKLEAVVHQLGELVSSMASSDEKYRQAASLREDKLIAIIEDLQSSRRAATPSRDSQQVPSTGGSPDDAVQSQHEQRQPKQRTADETLADAIKTVSQFLNEGRHLLQTGQSQEGKAQLALMMHAWLASGDDPLPQRIFDYCLAQEDPTFMFQLDDPLYLFIAMKALTNNMDRAATLMARLSWLNTAINAARNYDYSRTATVSTMLDSATRLSLTRTQDLLEHFPKVVTYVRDDLQRVYDNHKNGGNGQLSKYLITMIGSADHLLAQMRR